MTYAPFSTFGSDRPGAWLITCDHATNTIPKFIGNGTLGLPKSEMKRHIAYDIGCKRVALALGEKLNAPVICSNFSRLVIDPNRGVDDPTLIMQLYDGTVIPGNQNLSSISRQTRINQLYKPYHKAISELAARPEIAIISVHSFTPRLNGRETRPWEVSILSAYDRRIADPLITRLQKTLSTPVGDNEPYIGHLPGDTIDQHALKKARPNALIEIRQDLITKLDSQIHWAKLIGSHLEHARKDANI